MKIYNVKTWLKYIKFKNKYSRLVATDDDLKEIFEYQLNKPKSEITIEYSISQQDKMMDLYLNNVKSHFYNTGGLIIR